MERHAVAQDIYLLNITRDAYPTLGSKKSQRFVTSLLSSLLNVELQMDYKHEDMIFRMSDHILMYYLSCCLHNHDTWN